MPKAGFPEKMILERVKDIYLKKLGSIFLQRPSGRGNCVAEVKEEEEEVVDYVVEKLLEK